MTKTKAKIGRPTKYKEQYCDSVIEWGKQGMSLHEMAIKMDIRYQTLNQWRKTKPDFSESIKRAVWFSQAWWERLGRLGSAGIIKINPKIYIYNMRNRFKEDWLR